jgi:hypothetical protein|tara:strand:- start:1317 stop:1943 length:627 start_codon:yes stop_codon:yes gene_type:complete
MGCSADSRKEPPMTETKAQRSMRASMDVPEKDRGVFYKCAAEREGVSAASIKAATSIRRYAPELVGPVERGELSLREALARMGSVGLDTSPAAIQRRYEDVRRLTEQGLRNESIAKQLGIAVSTVRRFSTDLGIQSVNRRYQSRTFDVSTAIDGLVMAAIVPTAIVDLLDERYGEIADDAQAARWIESLDESIEALTRLARSIETRGS